jgi:putative DNA-invertase from lambdoid prophage Rac
MANRFEYKKQKKMSRKYLYARVNGTEQTLASQLAEVTAAGFDVDARRIVAETVSGSIAARERPGFQRLFDRLEGGDILIVTKLDRLGRNAMDIRATVDNLDKRGVRVHCLALGGVDLTSPAGKVAMGVITVLAEFERDLLIERTHAGLKRVRDGGKTLGRPSVLSAEEQARVRQRIANGESLSALAREYKTTRQTIMRVRNRGKAESASQHASQLEKRTKVIASHATPFPGVSDCS